MHQAWALLVPPYSEAREILGLQTPPRSLDQKTQPRCHLPVPGPWDNATHSSGPPPHFCASGAGVQNRHCLQCTLKKHSLDLPLKLARGRLGTCHGKKRSTLPESPVSKVRERAGWCSRTDCPPRSPQRWPRVGGVSPGNLGKLLGMNTAACAITASTIPFREIVHQGV